MPPPLGMRDAAREIALALAVVKAAVEGGVAPETTKSELLAAVSATQWTPRCAPPREMSWLWIDLRVTG